MPKHFGAIANVGPSHVQSMCAIGIELQRLGHEFTLLGVESQVERAARYGIRVHRFGGDDPTIEYGTAVRENPNEFLRAQLHYMKKMTSLLCQEAPQALVEHKIDLLLADQEESGAATAADLARIPYITICSSLPLNEDSWAPPSFVGWRPGRHVLARFRNYLVYRTRNLIVRGVHGVVNRYRVNAGLNPYHRPDDSFSKLRQITQLVREFDFPRMNCPTVLTYVGPFQRGALKPVPFPYEKLDGRPVIYGSLGTVQGCRTDLLLKIAQACADLPVQLILALGGATVTAVHQKFPGKPIVVGYAPQLELLRRAAVAMTHAGLNSILEALSCGVPLLSIPTNAGDQAGVAARVRHYGVGKVLFPKRVTAENIRRAILSLLHDSRYRNAAQGMKRAIDLTGGAAEAASVICASAFPLGRQVIP